MNYRQQKRVSHKKFEFASINNNRPVEIKTGSTILFNTIGTGPFYAMVLIMSIRYLSV